MQTDPGYAWRCRPIRLERESSHPGAAHDIHQGLILRRAAQDGFKEWPAAVNRDQVFVARLGCFTHETSAQVILPGASMQHGLQHVRRVLTERAARSAEQAMWQAVVGHA
jgi:hypothetical protein